MCRIGIDEDLNSDLILLYKEEHFVGDGFFSDIKAVLATLYIK